MSTKKKLLLTAYALETAFQFVKMSVHLWFDNRVAEIIAQGLENKS